MAAVLLNLVFNHPGDGREAHDVTHPMEAGEEIVADGTPCAPGRLSWRGEAGAGPLEAWPRGEAWGAGPLGARRRAEAWGGIAVGPGEARAPRRSLGDVVEV
ncbi:hypothetical protein GCM10010121_051980 [Streptomyces brasiliensis]|uniref:Uncharacterized protein n=1 Tax=Streptomyces brasiliensis TaxID=1954 RepID=A0A917KX18_9ACTN|nr:hypothetical protein GCM10010121_051980 [Streptomyces brasiliensis]